MNPNQPERLPKGRGREITPLVIEDLKLRTELGTKKYGEPLRALNGRNALVDAYQEALDLAQYLRQAIEEQGAFETASSDAAAVLRERVRVLEEHADLMAAALEAADAYNLANHGEPCRDPEKCDEPDFCGVWAGIRTAVRRHRALREPEPTGPSREWMEKHDDDGNVQAGGLAADLGMLRERSKDSTAAFDEEAEARLRWFAELTAGDTKQWSGPEDESPVPGMRADIRMALVEIAAERERADGLAGQLDAAETECRIRSKHIDELGHVMAVLRERVRVLEEALRELLAHPSDDWQDAKDVPHPVLGIATLTPLQIAESTARRALREPGRTLTEGGENA